MRRTAEFLFNAADWVFDLDNTLYPPECDLFSQITAKMNQYVAKHLDLPLDAALEVQKKYYVEHGTTLNGMMLNHDIDPHDYLHHVHDIDYSLIPKNPKLREAILELPGRKLVFTNGSKKHAENAISQLGLDGVFADITDIAATNFRPKPERSAFETLLATHDIDPNKAVMVEDLSKNLVTAHEMGFATVLVWSNKQWPHEPKGHAPAGPKDIDKEHIHHATNDLTSFIKGVVNSQNNG